MSCFYDDGLHVLLYYNGRTDRASLHFATRLALTGTDV